MKQNIFILFVMLLAGVSAFAQDTRINPAVMLRPGANNTVLQTDASGNVGWVAKSTVYSAGTGITVSAAGVIANSAPDQTVVLISGTGISVTGTYPNFTVTNSAPNVMQTLGVTGTSTPVVTLSGGGGTVTFASGAGISLSNSGGTITVASTIAASTLTVTPFKQAISSNTTTVTVSGFTPGAATMVYLDGVHMEPGSGNDYTIAGNVLTFTRTLLTGQKVTAYHYSL
jgi:hypothetical protein